MLIQTITAEIVKVIARQTGYTVDVMFIDERMYVSCTREAVEAVKATMAQVNNATLQTEHDWQDDPDFQEFPIELTYAT